MYKHTVCHPYAVAYELSNGKVYRITDHSCPTDTAVLLPCAGVNGNVQ